MNHGRGDYSANITGRFAKLSLVMDDLIRSNWVVNYFRLTAVALSRVTGYPRIHQSYCEQTHYRVRISLTNLSVLGVQTLAE
jgi:hypothetical protein